MDITYVLIFYVYMVLVTLWAVFEFKYAISSLIIAILWPIILPARMVRILFNL